MNLGKESSLCSVVVLAMLIGCQQSIDETILLDPSETFLSYKFHNGMTGRDVAQLGMAQWDCFNVRIKLTSTFEEYNDPNRLRLFNRKPADPNNHGTFSNADGSIQIGLEQDMDPIFAALILAHEIGHALGLDHVNGKDSIMNHAVPMAYFFSQEDIKEFQRVWGPRAHTYD